MKYQLTDLIDMEQFQMLQDRLNEIYSFPSAIIDNQGTVLTATAWQDICTKFHRRHKECEKECIKSDQYILEHIHEANPAVSYECPHGLIDNATPIIIDGVHYGNFFTGQFFLEKPDIERFRKQAKKHGFDESEYLKAVKQVPIWTKKQLENYLYFIKGMIEVISGIGLKRLRELEYQKKFADLSEFNTQVVNSAQDGIIIYDTDLKYKVWNPQMEKISGVCADKVLGKTPLEVFPFLKDTGVIERLQKALKGEQTESVDFPYHLPEFGRSGWASDTSGALRNNEGKIIGIIGVVRDITERKLAEQALRESEGRYRRLFEQSNDAVFIHDLNGRIFDVNEKACEMMGYSHEALLSMRLHELHPEHVLPHIQKQIELCHEMGEVKFETQFLKSDQHIVEVEVSARVIVKDKEIVQGIVRDITERKRAEQSLQESEERFRSLFGSMKEGVAIHKLIFDDSGVPMNYVLLDVNPQYEAVVGIRKESVAGKLATEIYSTEAPPYLSEYSSAVLTNQQMEFDTYFMPLNKHFHISVTNMGRSRFATIFTDITDRINTEREKEQLQRQLLHAQKIQAIGQLAGGIAHDFNNMLGIIMGNAQLLKTSSSTEVSESEEVSEIIAAAQRSRDLTSKLLLFARKDTVKKAEAVFVREIISTIQGMLKRTVAQNIVITSRIIDECKIKCDVSQITQALLNICINAVDAMPTGGNLIIECRNDTAEDGKCSICGNPMDMRCCAIEITDTGTGMPQDYIDKAIEPFFTTKGVGKGTGLGLSVTYGIIQGHNGHMHIQSALGQGTAVKILMPLTEDPVHDINDSQFSEYSAGKGCIMIVDDEKSMLKMAGKILNKAGYETICVDNGSEAVRLFAEKHNHIALVIQDMMMPDMDGAEVFGRMQEIDRDVKVLFASGQNISEEAESMFNQSRQKFIQKPFLIEEVLDAVRTLLES